MLEGRMKVSSEEHGVTVIFRPASDQIQGLGWFGSHPAGC